MRELSSKYLIHFGAVSSAVIARKFFEVGCLVSLVITIHGSHDARPRLRKHLPTNRNHCDQQNLHNRHQNNTVKLSHYQKCANTQPEV